MRNFALALFRDEEGLTMVEYAVAGGLVTLAAVAAFTALGTAIVIKITTLAAVVALAV